MSGQLEAADLRRSAKMMWKSICMFLVVASCACSPRQGPECEARISALQLKLLETEHLLEAQTERNLYLEGQLAVLERVKEVDLRDNLLEKIGD